MFHTILRQPSEVTKAWLDAIEPELKNLILDNKTFKLELPAPDEQMSNANEACTQRPLPPTTTSKLGKSLPPGNNQKNVIGRHIKRPSKNLLRLKQQVPQPIFGTKYKHILMPTTRSQPLRPPTNSIYKRYVARYLQAVLGSL